MNLEWGSQKRGSQNAIKKFVIDDKEITEQAHILEHIREFCKTLFKTREQKTKKETENFFSADDTPKLSENQVKLCEENLIKKDLCNSLKSMQSDKSPGNDGEKQKEFYETFWTELKKIFVDSVSEAKEKGILGTSQRQAVNKQIEKKDRDKRFIQNWRPISLLNVDLKIISKALSEKLKKVLPDLISSQQTAYVKNRHIGESGRLISDIIEISKI